MEDLDFCLKDQPTISIDVPAGHHSNLPPLSLNRLLYADDVALIAASTNNLAKLQQGSLRFTNRQSLRVNPKKSIYLEVTQKPSNTRVTWEGEEIVKQLSAKYVGVMMFANGRFQDARQVRIIPAKAAIARITSALQDNFSLHIVPLMRLWETVLLPTLIYACPIWSPGCSESHWAELQKVATSFIKRILHLPKNTSTKIVLAELGIFPIKIYALIEAACS